MSWDHVKDIFVAGPPWSPSLGVTGGAEEHLEPAWAARASRNGDEKWQGLFSGFDNNWQLFFARVVSK
jgi:hypothetical protein